MRTPTGPIIEVYADIWCPFAHVGLRAVEEQRARAGRADVAIWVRAWPLELVNGGPLDPVVTKEHADDLRAQVVPQLFHDLDVDHFPPSTLEALALANRAYRTDSKTGERMSLVLRDALFERGQNIADLATLEHLALDLGVVMPDESDRADVLTDWREGVERGVQGSPHFFCGNREVFCPSLDITRDPVEGLSIARDVSRLSEFLDLCFARTGST